MSALYDALSDLAKAREAALKAREQRFIDKAIAEARQFIVPRLGESQFEYEWNTDCAVPIICHMDYEPADGDNWNTPYYPENVTLCAAYLRGVDILEMLSPKQIDYIEEHALEQVSEDRKGQEEERAEARWHRDNVYHSGDES